MVNHIPRSIASLAFKERLLKVVGVGSPHSLDDFGVEPASLNLFGVLECVSVDGSFVAVMGHDSG